MKILLTTDLFFHPLSHEPTYHQWLFEILKPSLTSVPNVESVDLVHEVINNELSSSLLPTSPYDPVIGTDLRDLREKLLPLLDGYDHVVIFEASRQTRDWIVDHHPSVITLYLHPVRFHDDLLYSVWSNNSHIMSAMSNHSVVESDLHQLGRYWRELLRKKLPPLEAPDNTAILIGQTSTDMSVWDGKRMLTLADFPERLERICEDHDAVFYVPHPLDKGTNDEAISSMSKVQYSSENTYRWLAHDGVTVYAISSSVVTESAYFGAHGEYLWKPLFNDDGRSVTMGRQLFSSRLWRAAFGADPLPTSMENLFVQAKGSLIRDVNHSYWSLPFLNDVKAGRFPKRRVRFDFRRR
jgi:hypothetical protein